MYCRPAYSDLKYFVSLVHFWRDLSLDPDLENYRIECSDLSSQPSPDQPGSNILKEKIFCKDFMFLLFCLKKCDEIVCCY